MTAATEIIFRRWSAAFIGHPLKAVNRTKDPVPVFSTCVGFVPNRRLTNFL